MNAGVLLIGTVLFWILCCGIIAGIENAANRRKAERQRSREIYAENCRLKAEAERAKRREIFIVDMVRSEMAVKDLLLKQKWRDATHG